MVDIFTNFVFSTIGVSAVILVILLLKKCLHNHISPRWQYNIDILIVAMLTVPLLPNWIFRVLNLNNWLFNFNSASRIVLENINTPNNVIQTINGDHWMQDFSTSVSRFMLDEYFVVFFVLWIAGALAFSVAMFFGDRKLKLVIESVKPVENTVLLELFQQTKAKLQIKANILFGQSIMVKAPMTVGVFKPLVVLPFNIHDKFTKQEIHHILLHELAHCKRRDTLINNLLCFFQVIYWFNPLVYFTFRKIRLDREIACDYYVLNCLSEKNRICYGKTLINFVEKIPHFHALSFSMEMGGTRNQLTQRIKKIAVYKSETVWHRVKSIGIFAIIGIIVFSQAPSISALAAKTEGRYSFNGVSVQYEDLSYHFNGYQGSFVLYDLINEEYTIYNKAASETRISPVSTYKIYSALIAMEAGVIDTTRSVREWDGNSYPYDSWNQEQNLMTAMQNSVSWYFQDIDAHVGISELDSYFKKLSYGNQDLSAGIADYWMESSLRISPVEQVELLRGFYQNDIAIKPEFVDAVKDVIRLSEKDGAVLSGKTGTGAVNGKTINGWFIGYVEHDGNVYIFAANIQGKDNAGGSAAVQLTLSILEGKGIY